MTTLCFVFGRTQAAPSLFLYGFRKNRDFAGISLGSERFLREEEQRQQEGCSSRITRSISGHKYRSSSNPRCFPALEKGWQGNPPEISVVVSRPVFSKNASFVTVVMSRNFGTCGQCFFKTSIGKSAHSHWHTVVNPAASAARSIPPIPENRLKCVKAFIPSPPRLTGSS